MAASPRGSGTITGICPASTTVATATFSLAVSGTSATSVQIVLNQTVSGTHRDGTDRLECQFEWHGNDHHRAGTIQSAPPFASGDQSSSVTKVRQGGGASANYSCLAT